MRDVALYRYFLGFRPDAALRRRLACIGTEFGQWVHVELLHLTLCVIAEVAERDHFLLARVTAALAGRTLSSCPIHMGRFQGGENGAVVRTVGRQDDIQDFYQALLRLLRTRDLFPLHRKSGLNPHITLGHDACRFDQFRIPFKWVPNELLLIESEVGRTKHNVLAHWRLLPPPQGSFPFDPPPPALRLAS